MSNHGEKGGTPEMSKVFEKMRERGQDSRKELQRILRATQPAVPEDFVPLSEDDQGPIEFAVGSEGSKVFLRFHKPIDWLAMDPEHAVQLAQGLMEHARKAAAGSPITLKYPY